VKQFVAHYPLSAVALILCTVLELCLRDPYSDSDSCIITNELQPLECSFRPGTDLISLLVLFLLLFFFMLLRLLQKKPKASQFQIGSGWWNLAGMFFK